MKNSFNEEWLHREHPAYKEMSEALKDGVHLGEGHDREFAPKDQWMKRGFSIIGPCGLTFGTYELYDGQDTYRFNKLEEAQHKGDILIRNKFKD